jgi:membrane associated rhomboid family serine protease
MIIFTAFITWFLNSLLFPGDVIVGASGIVFMFIMLASITNIKGRQIPITLILIALLYLGQEIVNALKPDSISQFGHIVGGMCGTILGFIINYFKR